MENEKVLRRSVGGSAAINQALLCLPSVYFDPRRDFSSDKTFSKTQKKENHWEKSENSFRSLQLKFSLNQFSVK